MGYLIRFKSWKSIIIITEIENTKWQVMVEKKSKGLAHIALNLKKYI
jgi:hypothetical protein